jgi:hypothetical protein
VSALLTGPAFRPQDQFYLLALAFEYMAPEHTDYLLPLVMNAALVVDVGPAREAYAQIDRARAAIENARRATPNDQHPGGSL